MRKAIFILFFFVTVAAKATTYYISPTGSDSNNGSGSAPWKTLAYACTRATASGDIIHVNAGTYTETVQSVLAVGVSIEGAGVTSIIKSHVGGSSYTIELYSSTENTNGNQHISGLKMDGDNLTGYGAIAVLKRGNVEIYNCTIINFNYWGVTFLNGEPPATFATGNKIHDCIITNCAGFYGGAQGDIRVGGQDGLLIYNNTITQDRGTNDGDCIYGVEGFIKNVKIYNNTFTKVFTVGVTSWDFAIEIWNWLGGNEIYNNNITGSIDVVLASKGSSSYSVWIHNNRIGQSTLKAKQSIRGILIEYGCSDVIIERNYIHDVAQGVYLQQAGAVRTVQNIKVSYNILNNIGSLLNSTGWGIYWSVEERTDIANNINIWNNVIIAANNAYSTMYGIGLPDVGRGTNVSVRNNIIVGFEDSPIFAYGGGGTTIDRLSVENNIFYNNGNSNTPHYTGGMVPTQNTTRNNLTSNPLFLSSSDFHLQSGSPAIGKGLTISGLTTDYAGNALKVPPCIGAYESGTVAPPPPLALPVYQSSVVENASPSILTMTYNQTLAKIAPAASAFSVQVNSVARTVNAVVISGTRVQLTLASAIKYGDIVTLSYTKPTSNPLQNTTGGQAASISGKPVVNNLLSPVTPVTPVTISMTLSPKYVHKILNVLLAYSSSPTVPGAVASPQIIRIADHYTGKLVVEKLLVVGTTNVQIPLNLKTGIYGVRVFAGGLEMAFQNIRVYR